MKEYRNLKKELFYPPHVDNINQFPFLLSLKKYLEEVYSFIKENDEDEFDLSFSANFRYVSKSKELAYHNLKILKIENEKEE